MSREVVPVFYVSDATGVTASEMGKSVLTQFPSVKFKTKTYPFVTTVAEAERVLKKINKRADKYNSRAIVFHTITNPQIELVMEQSHAQVFPLISRIVSEVEKRFGMVAEARRGKSHGMGKEYNQRLEAINFALDCDDGLKTQDYEQADVVLVGVSRVGKTPTSLYLAMQYNVKAANYPLLEEDLVSSNPPLVLKPWINKCVGLTTVSSVLSKIREQRRPGSRYASMSQCRFELAQAETLYQQLGLLMIDTHDKSIEEISTLIVDRLELSH